MIVLPETWRERFGEKDIFECLSAIEGRVLRKQKGRKTLYFTVDGNAYYGKFHTGVGWKEIFKNIFQLRLPVLGAQNEWKAVQRIEELGVRSMNIVGYGKRGTNPSSMESFIITEELPHTISLENLCRCWPASPPEATLKRKLIREVARVARTLHENGVNHRDFYLCHFLLDMRGKDSRPSSPPALYLIDLHRAQIRGRTPKRWKIKDLAGLYFSSMDIGLTQRDLFLFIKVYCDKPVRTALREDGTMWLRVLKRAEKLYRKTWQREPAKTCR